MNKKPTKASLLTGGFLVLFILFQQNSFAQVNSPINTKARDLVYDGCMKNNAEDFTGAIKDFTAAIIINPKYADAYLRRGIAKYGLQKNKDAIIDFDKAIALRPEDAEAFMNRGLAKAALNDLSGAMADLDKTILLGQVYAEAFYFRGKLKAFMNNFSGAVADFNKIIEWQSGMHDYQTGLDINELYDRRGQAKYQMNDYSGALKDYNFSISAYEDGRRMYKLGMDLEFTDSALDEISPYYKRGNFSQEVGQVYYDRAVTKVALKDYPGALADYTSAIDTDEENPDYYFNRASVRIFLKDTSGGMADYTKTIELAPGSPDPWNYRGNIKYVLKDFAGAIADYTSYIKIDTKNADVYYFRGASRINMNQKESGCEDLKKAAALGLKDAVKLINLYCK